MAIPLPTTVHRRFMSHLAATPAWLCFLGLGLAMSAGYFLLPSETAQNLWYSALSLLTAVVIELGVRLNRPSRTLPWHLVAVMSLLFFIGDAIWNVYEIGLGIEAPFPSVADTAYLLGY